MKTINSRETMLWRRFGKLVVVCRHKTNPDLFGCLCDCDEFLYVSYRDLTGGRKHTCGCYEKIIHYGTVRDGSELSKTYRSWEAMKYRCLNPNSKDYVNYGGRGITVCDRWMKFENFLEDMDERPEGTTLGRLNNNGPYCKENCRWETPEEQQQNTRSNIYIGGVSVDELSNKTGLTPNAIYLRRLRGATDDEIIHTPVNTPRASTLRPSIPDLGQRNEKLVITGVRREDKDIIYTCRCDCGNIKEVTRRNFKKTKSCGCMRSEAAKNKKAAKPSSISQEYSSLPLFYSTSVGKKYSKLTIMEVRRKTSKPGVYVQYAKCKCDCGNETIVAMGNLTGNPQHTTSCGCAKVGAPGPSVSTIPVGTRFGKLLVCSIEVKHGTHTMVCRCDCGEMVKTAAQNLKFGHVTSCGCDSFPEKGSLSLYEPKKLEVKVIPDKIIENEIYLVPDTPICEKGPDSISSQTVKNIDGRADLEVEYRGETKTIREWVAELGLNLLTVLSRVSRGTTDPEKLLSFDNLPTGSKPGCKRPEGSGRGFSSVPGEKYGKLTIKSLSRVDRNGKTFTEALCICECGNEKSILLNNLRSGKQTSCGCSKKTPHNKGDYSVSVGQKFGRLTITNLYSNNNTSFAECQCDCGNIKQVAISNLKRGHIVSCGCFNKDRMVNNNPKGKKKEAV